MDALDASGLTDIPKGVPGAGKSAEYPITFDGSSVVKVLGLKYTSWEECMKDMGSAFRDKGWI